MSCARDTADGPPLARTTVCDDSVVLAVVRAVAAVENEQPQSLRPLGEVIDPEALETAATSLGAPDSVAFDYVGYRVMVDGETVEIY